MKEQGVTQKAPVSNTSASGFIWNGIGTVAVSLSTMVFMMVITNVMGVNEAGIFTIGAAFAQQLYSVVTYEIDTFQTTDAKNKYSHAQYNGARLVLIICALAAAVLIVHMRGYGIEKAAVVLLICLYKCLDGLTRAFYAIFQKNERIDIAGKIQTMKTVVSAILFSISLLLTKHMTFSLSVLVLSYLAIVLIWEIPKCAKYASISVAMGSDTLRILVQCFPLFAGTFILTFISNQSKYVLDSIATQEMCAVFNIIVTPAFVINMMSLTMFKPLLTNLAKELDAGDIKQFKKSIRNMYILITGFTVICVAACFVCGTQILSLLYGVALGDYRIHLCVLMIAGGFNAIAAFSHNVIGVLRKQVVILPIYTCGFILSISMTESMIRDNGLAGACIAYVASMACIAILMMVYIEVDTSKRKHIDFSEAKKDG